jgi:hypothetical protein
MADLRKFFPVENLLLYGSFELIVLAENLPPNGLGCQLLFSLQPTDSFLLAFNTFSTVNRMLNTRCKSLVYNRLSDYG